MTDPTYLDRQLQAIAPWAVADPTKFDFFLYSGRGQGYGKFTRTETAILRCLCAHGGWVSSETLTWEVYGHAKHRWIAELSRAHLSNIRRKGITIRNERGKGYALSWGVFPGHRPDYIPSQMESVDDGFGPEMVDRARTRLTRGPAYLRLLKGEGK